MGVVTAIGFLYKGGAPVELGLYLKGTLLGALFFVLMGLCALTLQVLSNNKFIGYLLVILLMVAQSVLGMLHFEHNLYNFAATPAIKYSDMNGYGHFLTGWAWFAVLEPVYRGAGHAGAGLLGARPVRRLARARAPGGPAPARPCRRRAGRGAAVLGRHGRC